MLPVKSIVSALALLSVAQVAMADRLVAERSSASDLTTFEVTITNTSKLTFTPLLVVAHKPEISLFEAGQPASDELALLAEGGATGPLSDVLATVPDLVSDFESTGGLLGPGESVTVEIEASRIFNRISVAAMLLPTNDSFVGLNSARIPGFTGTPARFTGIGYDAGSEPNDELCANIPGPQCMGAGDSPDAGGEGYVSVSAGIQGVGDLAAADYDWRNPVAAISIRRAISTR